MRNFVPLIVAIVVATAMQNAANAAAMSAEFKSGEARPFVIALLPAQAELSKKKVIQTEAMIDESVMLEEIVDRHLAASLEKKGYVVRLIGQDEINSDPRLSELARGFGARFDEEAPKVIRRPRKISKNEYTLGEEAILLADYLGVDGLLVSRLAAQIAAPGQMAKALLIGGSTGGTQIHVTLVDGNNGEVEAYFFGLRGILGEKGITEKAEEIIGNLTVKAVKRYPEATEEMRLAYEARAAQPTDDEADLLGEFEEMFGDGEDRVDTGN